MAGYIMTLDSVDSLKTCIETGTYSTKMPELSRNSWNMQQEGTYADYLSMKQGDNIYFFIKRKIYGIGRIINVESDCKYLNYIGADIPTNYSDEEYVKSNPVLPYSTKNNRCFCTFKPAPYFFLEGVDMDDALSSNPNKFRMLRAMWKVSFIKIDDEENKALLDIILKRNEEYIFSGKKTFQYSENIHIEIKNQISLSHRLSAYQIINSCKNGPLLKHEMAIEAALCELLVKDNDSPFGKWDYVSHQVVASPFKAVDYMDKMDVFGYRYIDGYSTISKYMIIEIKKDIATETIVDQIMKYVDWVQSEYAFGDYSMIEAYVVAAGFPDTVIDRKEKECVRQFTKGYRPAVPCVWKNVKLIKYEYKDGKLVFTEI